MISCVQNIDLKMPHANPVLELKLWFFTCLDMDILIAFQTQQVCPTTLVNGLASFQEFFSMSFEVNLG